SVDAGHGWLIFAVPATELANLRSLVQTKGLFMKIARMILVLVCLMSFAVAAKEAAKGTPVEAKVTPVFSKDLADIPGKERFVAVRGISPWQLGPYTSPQRARICLCP